MSSNRSKRGSKTSPTLEQQVEVKVARKLEAQQDSKQGIWFGLGTMGLIGWSIVVPTLLGTALGFWLDKKFPGKHTYTLALMVAGLGLGCLNAWHWVDKQQKAIRKDRQDDNK